MDGGRKHDYFHSLNYTLPSSHVNREAGRQAGRQARTHACTHAALFIQLRARAFDSRPFPYHRVPTDSLDLELNTKQISFRDTRRNIDTKLSTRLHACVRNEDARAKEHLRSREARKPSVCFSFHVGKGGPFEDLLFMEKFREDRVGIRTVFTVRYRLWFKLSGEERGRIRGVSINPIQF